MSFDSVGLPKALVEAYDSCGIRDLFPWQLECLSVPGVSEGGNLVFSAPTSAGKSLVAEIISIRRVLNTGLKCLFILPFISLAREKMLHLQRVCSSLGLRVEGFMGSLSGIDSWDIAVCTSEKANGLVNRFIEQQVIHTIGIVVVDELHSVGDSSRGYLLELLMTKLRYVSNKRYGKDQTVGGIQLVGMSATLPNLDLLARWMDAKLYVTDFRPVALVEMIKVNGELFNKQLQKIRNVAGVQSRAARDPDNVVGLCLETVLSRKGVLIFCPSKIQCENVARIIATEFHTIVTGLETPVSQALMEIYNEKKSNFAAFLSDFKRISLVIDPTLERMLFVGVAFHHAGLTMEEREQIERGFKRGLISVLVATSTLSSGVNLPAERVIIRSLWGNGSASAMGPTLNVASYKQMSGRAGRMGLDDSGESIIICQPNQVRRAVELITGDLSFISSCLWNGEDTNNITSPLKRALLEIIASGLVSSVNDALEYMKFTILSAEESLADKQECADGGGSVVGPLIHNCIKYLQENEFIRRDENDQLFSTQLGCAALASSLGPDEALAIFSDLQQARKCFCLENELQMVYLVTPVNASQHWRKELDWRQFYRIWSRLPNDLRRAAELMGVTDAFLSKAAGTGLSTATSESSSVCRANQVHLRFVSALALYDLISEVPLAHVTEKFGCNRGTLQSLQQQSSNYAGMVVSFCDRLGWWSLKALLAGMAERLAFGIRRELTELVTIEGIDGSRAKAFHQAGLSTVARLAVATPEEIIAVLRKAVPFESSLRGYRETEWEVSERIRRGQRHGWLSGHPDLTEAEAVEIIRHQARQILGGNLEQLGVNISDSFFDKKAASELKESGSRTDVVNIAEVKPSVAHSTVSSNAPTDKAILHPIRDISNVDIQPSCKEMNLSKSHLVVNCSTPVIENIPESKQFSSVRKTESAVVGNENEDPKSSKKTTSPSVASLIRNVRKLSLSPVLTQTRTGRRSQCVQQEGLSQIATTPLSLVQPDSPVAAADNSSFLTASQLRDFLESEAEDQNIANMKESTDRSDNCVTDTNFLTEGCSIDDVLSESLCRALDINSFDEVNDCPANPAKEPNLPSTTSDFNCDAEDAAELDDSLADFYPMLNSQPVATVDLPSEAKESVLSRAVKRSNIKNSQSPSPVQRKKSKIPLDDSSASDVHNDELLIQALDNTSALNCSLADENNIASKDTERIADLLTTSTINTKWTINVVNSVEGREEFVEKLNRFSAPIAVSLIPWAKGVGSNKSVAVCFGTNDVHLIDASKVAIEGETLAALWNSSKCRVMFHAKTTLQTVTGVFEQPIRFRCCQLAAWMLNSDRSSGTLQGFVLEFIPHAWKLFDELKSARPISPVQRQICLEAVVTYLLYPVLEKRLERDGLLDQYLQVELPFLAVVNRLERDGIGFDTVGATDLRKSLQSELQKLTEAAYEAAGRKFSLSSPDECAKVLFSELKLPPDGDPSRATGSNGRTSGKRHYSTKAEVLKKLSHLHPLPDIIMKWRTVHRSMHSALDCFIKVTQFSSGTKMDRICGIYDCLTATGRATMRDPSLQTMAKSELVFTPDGDVVQTETLSSTLRDIFIPTQGSVLLAADYSQLELRLLAHLSQDVKLLGILNSDGGDVFKMVAASLSKIQENEVTDTLRQQAKQICYGIIYGMGAKSLSTLLNSDLPTAESFLCRFKAEFPDVSRWVLETINSSHQSGDVKTMTGRIRRLEIGLALKGYAGRQRYDKGHLERQAVNTCVQGSASDLFKTAVGRIQQAIDNIGYSATVVLLMHDEVILEVPAALVDRVAQLVRCQMESSMDLSVKLPVKLKIGANWGTLVDLKL